MTLDADTTDNRNDLATVAAPPGPNWTESPDGSRRWGRTFQFPHNREDLIGSLEFAADRHDRASFRWTVAALVAVATDAVLVSVIFVLNELKTVDADVVAALARVVGALFMVAGFMWIQAINRRADGRRDRKLAASLGDVDVDVDVEPAHVDHQPITDLADLHLLPGEVAFPDGEPTVTGTGYSSGREWSSAVDRIGRRPSPHSPTRRRRPSSDGCPGRPLDPEFYRRAAAAGVREDLLDTMRRVDEMSARAERYFLTSPYAPDADHDVIDGQVEEGEAGSSSSNA